MSIEADVKHSELIRGTSYYRNSRRCARNEHGLISKAFIDARAVTKRRSAYGGA